MTEALSGKKILIVDDEPDVFETLKELLDMCIIDYAPDFDTAEKFLSKKIFWRNWLQETENGYEKVEIVRKTLYFSSL